MPALAVHEAVPGHHLQIAFALEMEDLPRFRRNAGFTAFVEGWGLYSERLGDEMGLYEDDLSRFGMLTYQAWRASRLVVDTGIHALRWTRDQAIEFLMENLALSETEVLNEVDRYIIWPGQALAYMIGKREILALREEARKAMGPRFDIREFHDVVLRNGALPLTTLRRLVEEWAALGT
jgi:prolyl oligopeptidase